MAPFWAPKDDTPYLAHQITHLISVPDNTSDLAHQTARLIPPSDPAHQIPRWDGGIHGPKMAPILGPTDGTTDSPLQITHHIQRSR